ncbi:hypothetical protein ES319_A09G117700v1 [Gossypium barbadense]|uniref:Uncharacterized protein n=2 Tax=Gossypium TaxID=3633 RepID=A0A5J5UEJ8_GOSBA|nr:hypothetical protein ES319_A09G117700v1 [Gossypium barbadense]TYH02405.1 hypothetical protein ES288_A09G138200v1 [Gossypium darwinii]
MQFGIISMQSNKCIKILSKTEKGKKLKESPLTNVVIIDLSLLLILNLYSLQKKVPWESARSWVMDARARGCVWACRRTWGAERGGLRRKGKKGT